MSDIEVDVVIAPQSGVPDRQIAVFRELVSKVEAALPHPG